MPGILSNDSNDTKAGRGHVGALADKREDPREKQMDGQLQTSVAARVADDGILEAVADKDVSAEEVADGMAARLAHDRRKPSYEWAAEPRGDEVARQPGWTEAQHERLQAREHELDRQRQKAHLADAHEVDRAQRCRDEVGETDTAIASRTDERDGLAETDPREELDQETLGAVNEAAHQIADHFDDRTAMGRAAFARRLASRVQDGESPTSAMFAIRETIERLPTVVQALDDIDPYEQYETSVEVEVVTLWTPKHGSQRQVGLVSDGSRAPVKVVVWKKAGDKPTLHEGDRVRLTRAKVNVYKGAPTLAVAGDTEITFLERNWGGPAPRLKSASPEPEPEPWSTDSDQHAWIRHQRTDREVSVTADGLAGLYTDAGELAAPARVDAAEVTLLWTVARQASEPKTFPELAQDDDGAGGGEEDWRWEPDITIGTPETASCPECGAEALSGYQQQVGSADEGMTSFKKCQECEHTWRGGY